MNFCKISFWKLWNKDLEFAKEITVSQGSNSTDFLFQNLGNGKTGDSDITWMISIVTAFWAGDDLRDVAREQNQF